MQLQAGLTAQPHSGIQSSLPAGSLLSLSASEPGVKAPGGTSFSEFLDRANEAYRSTTAASTSDISNSYSDAARRDAADRRDSAARETDGGQKDRSPAVRQDPGRIQNSKDSASPAAEKNSLPAKGSGRAASGEAGVSESSARKISDGGQAVSSESGKVGGQRKTEAGTAVLNREAALNRKESLAGSSLQKNISDKNGAAESAQDRHGAVPSSAKEGGSAAGELKTEQPQSAGAAAKKSAPNQSALKTESGAADKNIRNSREIKAGASADAEKNAAAGGAAALAASGIQLRKQTQAAVPAAENQGGEDTIQKGAARKKDGIPEIKVTDLRSGADAAAAQNSQVQSAKTAGEGGSAAQHGGSELELEFSLDGGARTADAKGRTQTAAGQFSTKSFSEALAARFEQNWNDQIVQNAHVILRNGNEGTIRLHLKPESLGGVKIELKLADNSISGKIVVESDEAKSAFERNMASLNDAFKQGGFDSAKLEVSVGSQNQGGSRNQQDDPVPFWSERHRFDAGGSSAAIQSGIAGPVPRSGVNILA